MFEELLSGIGDLLDRRGIPYMVIGGQAVLLYGEPRLTRDIDITLGVDTDRADAVLDIVRALALRPIPADIESFVKRTMVLPAIEERSGIRVDFIFSFTPYETQAIGRARRVGMKGREVSFASPEDLIIHKIFAGRPRDLEDAKAVVLKNPGIDIEYVRSWLGEFDRSSEKKDYLGTFESLLGG